jgi:putative hydrolase of the HAD superfamily
VIRAVVSDFGGVLTAPLSGAFIRVQDDVGVPLDALPKAMEAATRADGVNPLFRVETGEITEQVFLATLERRLAEIVGHEVTLHGFGERWLSALDPNDELFAYYRRLHERGTRFALCTNNVREWEPYWRGKLPIDEIFETVVDSGFVGVRKPDPRIYAIVLERLRLPAEACVFVDDLERNVAAAGELGFHTLHFRDTEQAIAELERLLGRS